MSADFQNEAILLFRDGSVHADSSNGTHRSCGNESLLVKLMSAVDVGGQLANVLFAEGLGTVLNAAVASSSSWLAMSNSVVSRALFPSHGCDAVKLTVGLSENLGHERRNVSNQRPLGRAPGGDS